MTYTNHTCTRYDIAEELKKRYDIAAKAKSRRHGVVSTKGIDCSLKEHRARWKKMDQAREVHIYIHMSACMMYVDA